MNSGNFCSIQFKLFWLPQLPVTGEQTRSSTKTNKQTKAKIIFVILANKYVTTYLPQLLQVMVASLILAILATSGTWQPISGI